MSYCRWSSDNYKSDLYCYEDFRGGWTTHVASNRIVGDVPPLPDILSVSTEDYMAAYRVQSAFLDTAERRPIGGPHDGETFNDHTLEAFKERLLSLRAAGYCFPDYVLEEVDEEMKDASA
jgi:hypothetical protein